MNIAYVSSEEYAKFAYTSILSLLDNNRDICDIRIYFIEDNIHAETRGKLIELVKGFNREIVFLKATDIYQPIKSIQTVTTHHDSLNIYASLFLTRIKDIDRILLIESDVIINGSISECYNVEMNGCLLSGLLMMLPSKYHIFDKEYPWFINGGILLFDLKKLRQYDSEKKIVQYFMNSKYKESAESALYSLYKDKVLPMLPRYHLIPEMILLNKKEREFFNKSTEYYSNEEYEDAKTNPIMIHYASSYFGRPWDIDCYHPYKENFIKYYENIPWNDKYIRFKKRKVDYLIKFLYKYKLLAITKKHLNYLRKIESPYNEKQI